MDATERDFQPQPLASRHQFWASAKSLVHASPRSCPSLERMRLALTAKHPGEDFMKYSTMEMFTLLESQYGTYPWQRVCRTCTWEPVLSWLLTHGPATMPVTFSSCQTMMKVDTYRPSARADARLRRVAAAAGLPVASSAVGPVATGLVPQAAADFLEANNVIVRSTRAATSSPDVVALAWGMWNEAFQGPDTDFEQALTLALDILAAPQQQALPPVSVRSRAAGPDSGVVSRSLSA